MRFAGKPPDIDPLVWKALVALDEVREQACAGVVQPSYALRLVLAFLYTRSDRVRAPYDQFWREIQDVGPDTQGDDIRGTRAMGSIQGIVRGLGMTFTVDMMIAMRKAHEPPPGSRTTTLATAPQVGMFRGSPGS